MKTILHSRCASALRVTLAALCILGSVVLLGLATAPAQSSRQAGVVTDRATLDPSGVVIETADANAAMVSPDAPPSCMAAWRNEPPLGTGRRNAVTVAVGAGLYAITGFTAAPNYTPVNERFDGTTWTNMAPIPVQHAQGQGDVIGTNIYIPGGFNSVQFGGVLDFMQIYSTTANSWSNGAPLPAARSGVAAVAFNNLLYIIAGYLPVGTGQTSVFIYNPMTNTYGNGAPMPVGNGNVAGVLFNGEIYVMGGGTSPGARYAYNPATDMWRTIAPIPTVDGTCQSSDAFVFENEIWVVGCLGQSMIANQVWIYNPTTDMWRAGTPLYTVDHQAPGADIFNGRAYVVGGGSAAGGSTAVESLGCSAPPQCQVCHKGTTTLTYNCADIQYQRHLDHGDPPNACPTPNPAIALTKLTNGTNNNSPTGPIVPVGSTVTFTYVVTNPGDVPLSSVTARDDNGTPANTADDFNPTFIGGDSNGNALLDLTETWTFTASRVATAGQYTNVGTASGTPAPPVGGSPVTATDIDNHFGAVPPMSRSR